VCKFHLSRIGWILSPLIGCNDDASDLMTNPVLAPVMQQTCLQVFFRLVDVEVLKLGSICSVIGEEYVE